MADTHTLSHTSYPGGIGKPAVRRPAFRPLLPKPCTQESSTSMPIHIHTRTSLSSRKRSSVKIDLHRRRRPSPRATRRSEPESLSPPAPALASPAATEPSPIDSPGSVSSAETQQPPQQPLPMPINSVSTASIFGPMPDLTTSDSVTSDSILSDDRFALDNYLADSLAMEPYEEQPLPDVFERMTPPETGKTDVFSSFPNEFDDLSEPYFAEEQRKESEPLADLSVLDFLAPSMDIN